jgi:hypothetical protein
MHRLLLCTALLFSLNCFADEAPADAPSVAPEFVKILNAARGNDPKAQVELAGIYNFGLRGLPMSTVQGEYWLCRAIHLKSDDAANKLRITMSRSLYLAERLKFFLMSDYKHQ